ncbi:MAG: hypothetical protein KGI60_03635 [Patescibacteria group bacterium]|nr:hypothetical protein [Patescibacteria group bacterium]
MADPLTTQRNIGELFAELPDKVRQWLSSEELVFIITDIENKLGISDEKTIVMPNLILRLVVQDIEPQDFIGELSNELGVDFSVAKTIAEEIERRALRPIQDELREKTGLETKLIYYGKPKEKVQNQQANAAAPLPPKPRFAPPAPLTSQPKPAQSPMQTKPQPMSLSGEKPMSPLTFRPASKEESAVLPQIVKKVPEPRMPEPPATPFILHQENPTFTPPAPPVPQPPAAAVQPRPSAIKQSLTMKVQNYYQSAPMPERTIAKPISVSVETPAADRAAMQAERAIPVSTKTPAPKLPAETHAVPLQTPNPPKPATTQQRVVHYSNLRTPLNVLGTPKAEPEQENTVDLRRFAKIDDNAVDLRPKESH